MILVSLDIKDIFMNISVSKVIIEISELIIVSKLIENNRMKNYIYKEQLINVMKECLNQNYFKFNNKFYTQEQGLPMG